MVERAGVLGRLPMIMCVCAWPLALAGCNTFALDSGNPRTAPQATIVGPQEAPRPMALSKQNTGTYPTFGRPLTAANSQIDDQQFTSAESQLSSLAAARASGAVSEAEYQRRVNALRKLASEQGAETERQFTN
ncbi:hypothetical protein ACFSE1_06510 [Rhizobium helianthi]|uniref:SHOCT domain-containing protein n=1 Tax=Rhizobium helianthi TaxID=1132695 RepID=A0ABW4M3W6_9HYPH